MHPIDVAYKRTADEIVERLSKIKVEVGAIELLATTKIAKLYDGKIAALRASAATMESQVNELKALISEDCGPVGGEDTALEEEQKPVTPSEWNNLARERNAMVSRVNEYLMPLCDHDNQPIPYFPSTASDLKKISRMFISNVKFLVPYKLTRQRRRGDSNPSSYRIDFYW